jgi:predicted ATPase
VEAVARHWAKRLTAAVKHWTPDSSGEDTDLDRALVLHGERPRPQGGCFLRAESMHRLFGDIDAGAGPHAGAARAFGGALNLRSHGESFLAFLESRLGERGLFVLDEPEAALSFTSCLRLLAIMDVAVERGSQVLLATHSPVLAAFPGATVLEFGEHGVRRTEWADLELVDHWRAFMDDPGMYLGPLFEQ